MPYIEDLKKKLIFNRNTLPTLTEQLDTKHTWFREIKLCSNKLELLKLVYS